MTNKSPYKPQKTPQPPTPVLVKPPNSHVYDVGCGVYQLQQNTTDRNQNHGLPR